MFISLNIYFTELYSNWSLILTSGDLIPFWEFDKKDVDLFLTLYILYFMIQIMNVWHLVSLSALLKNALFKAQFAVVWCSVWDPGQAGGLVYLAGWLQFGRLPRPI